MRIERTPTSLTIAVPTPGTRAPIVAQLIGVGCAASIVLYWLRDAPYWSLGLGVFYVFVGAKSFAEYYRPTTIVLDRGVLRIVTGGWRGEHSEEFGVVPDLGLSVNMVGERGQMEFFPMYELTIRSGEQRGAILRGHDRATLDVVRREITAWLEQRSVV